MNSSVFKFIPRHELLESVEKLDFSLLKKFNHNFELIGSEAVYTTYLKIYLMITHKEIFGGYLGFLSKYSSVDVVLNRYFWLRKFSGEYTLVSGFDSGIEHMIVVLIEEINYSIPDFNWELLKEVEESLHKEM